MLHIVTHFVDSAKNVVHYVTDIIILYNILSLLPLPVMYNEMCVNRMQHTHVVCVICVAYLRVGVFSAFD